MIGARQALWLLLPAALPAPAVERSGSVSAELRAFARPGAFAGQACLQPSLALEPELELERGDARFTVAPFLRLDARDTERTHADLRAASWRHLAGAWELRVGVDRVFWGVAESRHLVDVVNQADLVENPDEEDKLGQPMINLTLLTAWGDLDLFYLPRFRERTFPGRDGRLRFDPPVSDDPRFESGLGRWHPDAAVRWSHVIGAVDVGLSHFHGTSREPGFELVLDRAGEPAIRPRYAIIHQTGLDLQATLGAWLLKLEALARSGHGGRFLASVAGFEYTAFNVRGGLDLGVLAEHLYDGRDEAGPSGRVPPTLFDHHLFLGLRLTFNDVAGTRLLAGVVKDLDERGHVLTVEASRRFGGRWRGTLELRVFEDLPADGFFGFLDRDDHLQVGLAYFF